MKFYIKRRFTARADKTYQKAKKLIVKKKACTDLQQFCAIVELSPKDASVDIAKDKKHRRCFFSSLWIKISSRLASLAQRCKRHPPIKSARLFATAFVVLCLCAIAALISAVALFGTQLGKYETVTIPDLVSLSQKEAISVDNGRFEYEISYSYNPSATDDSVIAQTPHPGVSRKLYRTDGKIKLSLVINEKREPLTMPDLVGANIRDAELFLKNAGARVKIFEEYSDSHSKGTVIVCSHPTGTLLDERETVILRVSKGAQTVYATLPSLVGLGENEAVGKLLELGFSVGKITYVQSRSEIGTVTSQEYEEGTSLPVGTKISIAVSGGLYFE